MKSKKAAFTLSDFKFSRVLIEADKSGDSEIEVDFSPHGVFHKEEQFYELTLIFKAYNSEGGIENPFLMTELKALFSFAEEHTLENIPSYFYSNSLAIVYPYIRSFVSSVSLQAHMKPLILPTMNLSGLEIPLKENTIEK